MAKRVLDFAVALAALLVLSPVLLALALAVRLKLGAPVFHRPLRPGLNERLFRMVKFRTMSMATDATGALLPDDQRLAPFGAWLRRTSLDELPELWNVLKGEMSLVGPRPLLPQYLEVYSPVQRQRHQVRPGMTGWAQVNGRNAISWDEKFALDVWYVRNRSFWLDLKIILSTVATILRQENISASDHPTMPIFRGSAAAEPTSAPDALGSANGAQAWLSSPGATQAELPQRADRETGALRSHQEQT